MGKKPAPDKTIEERAAGYKRRERRSAMQRIGLLMLSIFGAAATVAATAAATGSGTVVLIGGLWTAFAGLFILASLGDLWDPAIPAVVTVFDRPIDTSPLPQVDGTPLYLYWDDLQRLAQEDQHQGLQGFEGALASGVARHDPARGISVIDDLLRHRDSFPPNGGIEQELKNVRGKLVAAQTAGAQFCLMRTASWSGAIETNLKLFYR